LQWVALQCNISSVVIFAAYTTMQTPTKQVKAPPTTNPMKVPTSHEGDARNQITSHEGKVNKQITQVMNPHEGDPTN
jgi:hypothetical protein